MGRDAPEKGWQRAELEWVEGRIKYENTIQRIIFLMPSTNQTGCLEPAVCFRNLISYTTHRGVEYYSDCQIERQTIGAKFHFITCLLRCWTLSQHEIIYRNTCNTKIFSFTHNMEIDTICVTNIHAP